MGKGKWPGMSAPSGGTKRHRRAARKKKVIRSTDLVQATSKLNSRTHTIYEFISRSGAKPRSRIQVTLLSDPPPDFKFVPVGMPELTETCKAISRKLNHKIYIVSPPIVQLSPLTAQGQRIGYHVHQEVWDLATESLLLNPTADFFLPPGQPEPIPDSQLAMTMQAEDGIRELYPRIPDVDKEMILDRSFKKGTQGTFGPVVGLSGDLPLAQRVHLAVLAHIRHCHTSYDYLRKEDRQHHADARKIVEPLCFNFLAQWRGDGDKSEDELDGEIREVIVLSDSDDMGSSGLQSKRLDEANSLQDGRRSLPMKPEVVRPGMRVRFTNAEDAGNNPFLMDRRQMHDYERSQCGFGRYGAAPEQAAHIEGS